MYFHPLGDGVGSYIRLPFTLVHCTRPRSETFKSGECAFHVSPGKGSLSCLITV